LSPQKAFRRQYKLNADDAAIAEQQISEMLEIGVLEPATSAKYNSPLFLVGKKDGSKRLVIDLRLINALIKPQLVSLPRVTEMLDDILACRPRFISVADLRSGYWQVKVGKA